MIRTYTKTFSSIILIARRPFNHLYLIGQDIMTGGVGSGLFLGVQTVTILTGKNILNKIMKPKVIN